MLNCSVVSNCLWPHGLQSARFLCPWDFPSRVLDWVSISSPGESSWHRDQTHVFWLAGRFFAPKPPGGHPCAFSSQGEGAASVADRALQNLLRGSHQNQVAFSSSPLTTLILTSHHQDPICPLCLCLLFASTIVQVLTIWRKAVPRPWKSQGTTVSFSTSFFILDFFFFSIFLNLELSGFGRSTPADRLLCWWTFSPNLTWWRRYKEVLALHLHCQECTSLVSSSALTSAGHSGLWDQGLGDQGWHLSFTDSTSIEGPAVLSSAQLSLC